MLHLVLKPHRETLRAQASDAQKLFVLLKVIPAAQLGAVRPPLALAFVVDSSGSMREAGAGTGAPRGEATSKLEFAIRATEAVIADQRLVAGDLVCVVQFDDVARVVLPLEPLGDRAAARAAVGTIRGYTGGTQIAKGLRAARDELARILQGGVAQRVLLLTDGQAFDADACREAARQLAEANVPLIAIGVGDDYNEELLRDLAEIARGRPYHLPQMERLEEVFGFEVQTSTREVVTGLRARVQTVAGVSLDSATRVYPDLAEMKVDTTQAEDAAVVPLGNIMTGDYTVFVLEMTVSGLARSEGRARLAQVQLFGRVPIFQDEIQSPLQDIVVSFSGEEAQAEEVNEEVLGYVEQRNVDRLVQNAVKRAPHDVPGAKRSLQTAMEISRRVGNARATRMLQQSLDELGTGGKMSPSTRKTVLLETRTRTVKTMSSDALADVPDDDDIRRLTGA